MKDNLTDTSHLTIDYKKYLQEHFFPAFSRFKIRRFFTQGNVIINEISNDGIVPVWQDKPHLSILLRYNRHHGQVVHIDIGRTEKIVQRMHQYRYRLIC